MTATRRHTFGFSPCPNDTFAFHALVNGLIDDPIDVTPVMDDIEALNQRAHSSELEFSKLSIGALAALGDRYAALRSGAALGRGVGPLVVARHDGPRELAQAAAGPIAIPGRDTTAFLLLRLAAGEALGDVVEMRYDDVLGAVERGEVAAGLIIHESRFTYRDHGLRRVCDLGEWWEAESGLPVPLATICARADIEADEREAFTLALRRSVQHAFDHPDASSAFVREHAQEMSPDVQRQHISLYVNDFTLDLGDAGMRAIDALLRAAAARPR